MIQRIRWHLSIFVLVALVGCATPPAKLADQDFVIRTMFHPSPAPEVVHRLYEGFRQCGASKAGGAPRCGPPAPSGETVCDVFVPAAFGGDSDFVLGRFEVKPDDRGSQTRLLVQSYAAKSQQYLDAWSAFAAGEYARCEG